MNMISNFFVGSQFWRASALCPFCGCFVLGCAHFFSNLILVILLYSLSGLDLLLNPGQIAFMRFSSMIFWQSFCGPVALHLG